jgi:hypothetical protein
MKEEIIKVGVVRNGIMFTEDCIEDMVKEYEEHHRKKVIHEEDKVVGLARLQREGDSLFADYKILNSLESENYSLEPMFTYVPICSKCGKNFTECEHWIDEEGVHILAKDCQLLSLSLVKKNGE